VNTRPVLSSLVSRVRFTGRRRRARLPLHGFPVDDFPTPRLDELADSDLDRLNNLLPWAAFTVDGRGRRFGGAAWKGKRDKPQPIADYRGIILDRHFGLADKHVLEIGCFEGVHTVGLCRLAARVTGVDARMDNVVKTIVRCAFYGQHPDILLRDVEDPTVMSALQADVVHHVGVLYHLDEPARHIMALGRVARLGVLLDTHVAEAHEATEVLEIDGRRYPYRLYSEGGTADVFSGMRSSAKWLTLEGLKDLVDAAGFPNVDTVEDRQERNGRRVLLVASRERAPR
jgi:SAM-dependent methyltransferase